MRVLHLFKTYYPDSFGGVERTIRAIAKGTLLHGVQSDGLSLSHNPTGNTLEFDDHMAHKAKLDFEFSSTGFSLDFICKFKALSAKADVVHYHFPWPFMDLLHLLHPHGKPTVVTYHSDIVRQSLSQKLLFQLYKPLMYRFLESVDRIVATSPNYLESSKVLQRYQGKTEIIPIGLDKADYPRASEELKASWRARYPKPFFLFVGVLRHYKGLHTLIEAAKGVDADLLIVGDGPMQRELNALVTHAAVPNVHFLGAVSDIDKAALLELCSAFVFPSHLRSEAYGLSLVEAAMFGKPMISCEIGTGTGFVNRHGETGMEVPPEDATALAEAMSKMLREPDVAMKYGLNAKRRYHETLGIHAMVDGYILQYNAIRKAN